MHCQGSLGWDISAKMSRTGETRYWTGGGKGAPGGGHRRCRLEGRTSRNGEKVLLRCRDVNWRGEQCEVRLERWALVPERSLWLQGGKFPPAEF